MVGSNLIVVDWPILIGLLFFLVVYMEAADSEHPTSHLKSGATIESNPVIISTQTGLDGYRLKNFYITNALQ